MQSTCKAETFLWSDEVTTVPKVDSVLSVNAWQYPNHLAQFSRLLSYLHACLEIKLDRIVSTAKKRCSVFEIKWSQTLLEQSWSWVYQDDKQRMLSVIFRRLIWNCSSDRKQICSHSCRALHATTNGGLFSHLSQSEFCLCVQSGNVCLLICNT